MSLYEGIEDKNESGMGWSSANLSLMQQQIKLKKAQATTAMREKRLAQAQATAVTNQQAAGTSSVVDLTSKGGPLSKQMKFGSGRKVVTDGLPLSFLPPTAKEEGKVVIFGEVEIEDEYNPMIPNDYEQCLAERNAERVKKKVEEKARQLELSETKQQRVAVRDEEREARQEQQKRSLGAAIAPPSALIEQDKRVHEHPAPSPEASFKPKFGAGSRGLNNAAKMMEMMGYKEGLGLGKNSQGMSTALQVEKIGMRGGAIIDVDKIKAEMEPASSNSPPVDSFLMPPPPPVAATDHKPITEVLKNPTKILLMKNMVGPGEVDGDLEPEVKEEMQKYGDPQKVLIYELPSVPEDEAVRIFVEFGKIDHAIKAVVDLNGRFFGGRLINAGFYPVDKFHNLELNL